MAKPGIDMKRSSILVALTLSMLLAANAWAVPARPTPLAQQPTASYQVKKGDSLYAIARRNGLSVAELKRLNGLKSDALKPGQRLLLSSSEGPSPAPAVATGSDPANLLRQETAASPGTEPALLAEGLEVLEEVAFSYLATPYRFGGSSRQGIDCSSFVRNVFRELKIDLPRTAREQYRLGAGIAADDLQGGDLLFFRTYAKYPSHVGIYLGGQKMIHASPRSRRVVIADVDTPYFRSRYIGARRLAMLGGSINFEALTRNVVEDAEGFLEDEIDPAVAAGGN